MSNAKIVVLSVVLSVLAAYGTSRYLTPASGTPAAVKEDKKETVFDRVMRTRTLRCAYTPYPPLVIKDANTGKLSGFMYDLVEEMGKQLSLKIEWTVEVAPAGMFEGFLANQYDAICAGYFRNPARATRGDFTDPLFFMASSVYVRADDTRFDSDMYLLNSKEYSFATIDGEIAAFTVKEDFPQARVSSLPETAISDVSIRMLNVTTKKNDATIIEDVLANDFSKKSPVQIKALLPPVRVQGSTIIVPQNEYPLKRMLDASIANMLDTGTIKHKILEYTDGYGYYLSANPYKIESLKK